MRIRLMVLDLTGVYGGIAHHSQSQASIEPNPGMTRVLAPFCLPLVSTIILEERLDRLLSARTGSQHIPMRTRRIIRCLDDPILE
jgi:hypothetical protein